MNGNALVIAFGMFLFLIAPLVSAGVQVTTFSITPTTLKPGMSGTISLTLNNPSATEFITAAYLKARANGINFVPETKIGDLGAEGTTIVAIPFTVAENTNPGVIPVTLELSYTSSVSEGGNYKSFSIPLTVSATNLLKVTDVEISQDTIFPGDSFTIDAVIEDSGGPIKNAVLSYSATAAYTFEGTSKLDVGNLAAGERKSIRIPVIAGNSITGGYYSIPFTITFDDAVTAGNVDTLYFGPVTAIQDTAKFAISAEAIDATPGGKGIFRIAVENTGTNDLRNFKIALPQSATFFTPLDFAEKTIDVIKSGETKTIDFDVGIGTNIVPQVYQLQLTTTYQTKSGSQTAEKTVGVKIGGAPDLSVYLSSNPAVISNDNKVYSISVQVANTGNSAVRALSLKAGAKELEILGAADSFIGTLSLDDYSTVQFDAVVAKGIAPGKYRMAVELSYKDSYNTPHIENKYVEYDIYSQEVALLASKQNGNNPMVMVAIGIVILIVAYFAYKRFFRSQMSQKLKLK